MRRAPSVSAAERERYVPRSTSASTAATSSSGMRSAIWVVMHAVYRRVRRLSLRLPDERADVLAGQDRGEGAGRLRADDVDRQAVVAGEQERALVHHAQVARDGLVVAEAGETAGVRARRRVGVVGRVDAVLRDEQRVGAELEGALHGRVVGRHERLADPAGQDDDEAALEVRDGPQADVWLGERLHGDR